MYYNIYICKTQLQESEAQIPQVGLMLSLSYPTSTPWLLEPYILYILRKTWRLLI